MEIRRLDPRVVPYAAWIGFSLFVLLNAWVSEDAYITLRVVDNFFHGYGLRWNVNERVQVYTHPLWLLLHIPLRVFIPNLFIVSIVLSVLCTSAALFVTLACVRKPPLIVLFGLFLPLLMSKCFMDFTSSGLENPLSYLLFAGFGYVVIRMHHHRHFWFYCSLAVALALLNRLDSVILYAPALVWLAASRLRQIRWEQVLLGALPLLAWFAFALFYYGFLFPNTKYAKLDTGLDAMRYLKEGMRYAKFMLATDASSGLMILFAPAFVYLALRRSASLKHPLAFFPLCVVLGIYLNVLYIINIGGDYMIGRFWSLPVFVSIWLAYVFMPPAVNPRLLWALACALVFLSPHMPIMKMVRKHCSSCVIEIGRMMDAKYMFGGNVLFPKLKPLKINTTANHKFVGWGKALAAKVPPHTEKAHYIGMVGFYAGPGNILIDEMALSDALLARLPVSPETEFYIGHFRRKIPDGYIEAVRTGSTDKMDPSLAKYYEKLKLITSGDLLDPERLKTIVDFNLGQYDRWKYDYLNCNNW